MTETTTTAVIESVTSKEGAKDGKPWRKFTVKTEDGTFYSTFRKEVAEAAHALQGQRAEITWKPSGNEGQFKDITAAKAATNGAVQPGAIPTEKTDDGETDWSVVGLRKTRCLLWANYLQSPLAVVAGTVVDSGNEGYSADEVYRFGKALIALAERDVYWREPAAEDEDVPFG